MPPGIGYKGKSKAARAKAPGQVKKGRTLTPKARAKIRKTQRTTTRKS